MLTELRIRNFAIIDNLQLGLNAGLIVFTGETGAGKSIIMDALELLLGGRADMTAIRSGSDFAFVEATFKIPDIVKEPVHQLLDSEDLLDDPDYLSITRELKRSGRSIARVNGRTASIKLIRALAEYLVDIHGQSEHLSLLKVRQHLLLLDRYANNQEDLSSYKSTYKRYQENRKSLDDLKKLDQDSSQRAELLRYQINEINSAALKPVEDQSLREERNRLANAENLSRIAQETLELLETESPEQPSLNDLFGKLIDRVHNLIQIDPSQEKVVSLSETISEEITDLTTIIRDYSDQIEYNPERLGQVEERLALIHSLKRKYGESIPEILGYAENAEKDLENITFAKEKIKTLEQDQASILNDLSDLANRLSKTRKSAAKKLSEEISIELNELRMQDAKFQVDFQLQPADNGLITPDGKRVDFTLNGYDRIEYLIETNPGEGFKPLVKIASGGETARLMLALKNVLTKADQVKTLVFDEIDQGIGGRVGSIVGQKLRVLASTHQVLCITHLPQLAAYGIQHYQVDKAVEASRTITTVTEITGESRLQELAQMMGDVNVGTLKSAQELLRAVDIFSSN